MWRQGRKFQHWGSAEPLLQHWALREPAWAIGTCYSLGTLWSFLAQGGWSSPPGERIGRQGALRAPCLGGEAGGRFLAQQPVSSQLVAFTEQDHAQDPRRSSWAMTLCLAGSLYRADITCSCFYDLATNFPFPFWLWDVENLSKDLSVLEYILHKILFTLTTKVNLGHCTKLPGVLKNFFNFFLVHPENT